MTGLAGTARSRQGRDFWRGEATLVGEHRSGIYYAFDGRRSGNTFLLVGLELFSCRGPPQLLFLVLLQKFHVQVPDRFDPVFVHLDG